MSSSLIALCTSWLAGYELAGHGCVVRSSSSVTGVQWTVLEPLLPSPGNPKRKRRQIQNTAGSFILDAIFSLVRDGIARRSKGPWNM